MCLKPMTGHRVAPESNQTRDEQKPVRPAKTKDRKSNRSVAGDSNVSMSSSAQNMTDQERTGVDGERCTGPRSNGPGGMHPERHQKKDTSDRKKPSQ